MLKVRGGLDLGEESVGPDDSGELRFENLDRDLPLVLQVIGQVDRGHSAFAEFALQSVATVESVIQA